MRKRHTNPIKNEIVTVSRGARQIRDNGPSKKPDSDIALEDRMARLGGTTRLKCEYKGKINFEKK